MQRLKMESFVLGFQKELQVKVLEEIVEKFEIFCFSLS